MNSSQGGYGMGGSGAGILDELKNAFNRPDNGLMQIILINIIVWVVVILLRVVLIIGGQEELYSTVIGWFMLPASLSDFLMRPWSLVTYFFLHEGVMHILFNMLFLYWFGRIIKEFLGDAKVVNLYVLGGLAGGLFYLLIYNLFPYFADQVAYSRLLGASAGVFAVVVGAATLMPNYTMFLLFIGPVRIKYIALFYIILSIAGSAGANAGGELAHLGGALLGYLYIRQLQQGNDWGRWVQGFLAFAKGLFKPRPKVRVSYRSGKGGRTTTRRSADKATPVTSQEEIDAILDKISQSGYESLTKEEKQKLFNASRH